MRWHENQETKLKNVLYMTDVPITLQYRINGHQGLLYVRELVFGEIIARIPSSKSTSVATDANDVATECISAFEGVIDSVLHDIDAVCVTCRITHK